MTLGNCVLLLFVIRLRRFGHDFLQLFTIAGIALMKQLRKPNITKWSISNGNTCNNDSMPGDRHEGNTLRKKAAEYHFTHPPTHRPTRPPTHPSTHPYAYIAHAHQYIKWEDLASAPRSPLFLAFVLRCGWASAHVHLGT